VVHESGCGTFRKYSSISPSSAYSAEADIARTTFHNIGSAKRGRRRMSSRRQRSFPPEICTASPPDVLQSRLLEVVKSRDAADVI
jgi:hypothetical protein